MVKVRLNDVIQEAWLQYVPNIIAVALTVDIKPVISARA